VLVEDALDVDDSKAVLISLIMLQRSIVGQPSAAAVATITNGGDDSAQLLVTCLEHGAEVLRIYLAAEDSMSALRRKKAGGKRGKRFTEG
jgi:hypothetical protein